MRPSLKYCKTIRWQNLDMEKRICMSGRIFLGYQFPITSTDPNEYYWEQQQKIRGQRHAFEWQGQEKKSASDNRSDRDSNLNARAASSIVSVRKSRSEAKSSKLLQREWKSWLFSWSDLQSNFVKHIVQSIRVDCEQSAHSASSYAWEHNSDATQYNYVRKLSHLVKISWSNSRSGVT